MLTADAYRDRITIETRTSVEGTFGATATEWSILTTRWARRVPVSAQYAMVLAQRGHEERVEHLILRGDLVIDIANTRFLINGRYYRAIEPPEHDVESNETTVLIAQEAQR